MDLATRKYHLIRQLTEVTDEEILSSLEEILGHEISESQKKELDNRIESFEKNPDKLLDWDSFKETW